MKRIAIYVDTRYNQGGTFQYTKSLINGIIALSPDEFSITLLYTSKSWEDYLKSFSQVDLIYLKKSSFLVRLYQILISLGFLRIVKFFANKLDREIKIINYQNFDFIIFPAGETIACLVNTNVIGTIHDLMHRYERRFRESGGFFRYRFRENYYKQILLSSKAVLVDSDLGARHVKESYRKINARIFVLPYIAPDYIYHTIPEKSFPLNCKEILSNYIFYPAQFWPHKNHYNLLKALNILKGRGLTVNLVLCGKKDREYDNLNKYVKDKNLIDQVQFLGYIDDAELIYLYRNALAMVMPTFYGPTNIPPIEAILLGCPPLVSDIYGMPEQFGDAAIYFNPNDPFEIAGCIESILNDESRKKLIQKGEAIRMKFSQERFEVDLKNILNDLYQNQTKSLQF
jgi:glycosyltransferase involved in cell wall biosynthesis